MTTTNLVVNLNKIRAANTKNRPAETSVVVFDYLAAQSVAGQERQRPLVTVIEDSLQKDANGDWVFKGVNLYRINAKTKGVQGAIRTFRVRSINGLVRRP